MKAISSWGRLSHEGHDVIPLSDRYRVAKLIQTQEGRAGVAHGMGRSYGDVALNPNGLLWLTTGLNHFVNFNEHSGRLRCEAGVLLRDIQRLLIPRGWALPVTPGSQMVTVGGAIANDVHGKNHHLLGSFGDHIQSIRLIRTDGTEIECGPSLNTEWFAATVGGLGLTGLIVEAEIQLRPTIGPWLDTETIPYANLSEFFDLADSSEKDWEHTVSWIDCMSNKGQGIFMRANPNKDLKEAPKIKAEKKIPFVPPISLANSLTPVSYTHLTLPTIYSV